MDKELCKQKMEEHEKMFNNHERRIEKLEDTYNTLKTMDYRLGKVETVVSKIDTKLSKQQEKNGMKWDKLIDYLFYAIVAYALFKLGLKG